MPPRLPLRALQPVNNASKFAISSFLVPFVQSQHRQASILNSLSNNGALNKKIRRGRGPSSGKGKTSGRGHNGQHKRGTVPAGFNGGQTSEEIAHGKYGFRNPHTVEMSPVNLSRIQEWIDAGRLDASKPITLKELTASRAIHGIKDGVKLLADGAATFKTPVHIVVSRASQSAIEAVEAAGGKVTTRFYTPTAIRRIRHLQMHPFISLQWDPSALHESKLIPEKSPELGLTPEERVTGLGFRYRLPDPSSRKDIEYYRDIKNRGYLAHRVKEGELASLYFKAPLGEEELKQLKQNAASTPGARKREENKLW